MTLSDLLAAARERRGTDLHLSAGSPPRVRVDGLLQSLELPVLTSEAIWALVCTVLTAGQRDAFDERWELDVGFGLPGLGRFRCNLFRQQGAVAAVIRLIPECPPTFAQLGLPSVVARLADRPRGLVLVTGATGCGKSTTLAAMVDRINAVRPGHILTIEDPIEYLHGHKTSLVSQREVHTDTHSVAAALRGALREDPDVVLVGEMRDLETLEAAMTLAETGHLTLATLHTNSAAQTITRIIDAFPAAQQAQVRTQLSLVIEGIVCQALVPKAKGGRVAALEILVATPAIRSLIREGRIHQIYSAMQSGQDTHHMQTLNQALAGLARAGTVTREAAVAASSNREELVAMLERHRVAS